MKNFLRSLFSIILKPLESGNEAYIYKAINRKILFIMGALFLALASGVVFTYINYMNSSNANAAYLTPAAVFGLVGFACVIVAALGNDRAIAKIWGTRS